MALVARQRAGLVTPPGTPEDEEGLDEPVEPGSERETARRGVAKLMKAMLRPGVQRPRST